ncbi:MAG: triose-phosphate isomerase [Candidatus Limnocylindria bacterium]
MRTRLVAGNWKMNPTSLDEAVGLALEVADGTASLPIRTVICPPSIWLHAVANTVAGSGLAIGAQNMHDQERGAFTGEVSPMMLRGVVEFCILGHSERRILFHETDDDVGRKVASAAAHGIRPIAAIGERLEEREAGLTEAIIDRQLRAAVRDVDVAASGLVVAYEPVWAIGTGVAASPADARAAAGQIRGILREVAGAAGEDVHILYGGSVTADNAHEFFGEAEVDGALVGGASLDGRQFAAIARAAAIGA